MREIWERHDHLMEITPKRSQYWGHAKAVEEAEEWAITDADINEDEFLSEGADLIIAWMTTMKSAGYSMDVALEAIQIKLEAVIDRAERTNIMTIENGSTWDNNYKRIKAFDIDY
jgi:phosphoribosyl-ATP pyrophosphohydrolase